MDNLSLTFNKSISAEEVIKRIHNLSVFRKGFWKADFDHYEFFTKEGFCFTVNDYHSHVQVKRLQTQREVILHYAFSEDQNITRDLEVETLKETWEMFADLKPVSVKFESDIYLGPSEFILETINALKTKGFNEDLGVWREGKPYEVDLQKGHILVKLYRINSREKIKYPKAFDHLTKLEIDLPIMTNPNLEGLTRLLDLINIKFRGGIPEREKTLEILFNRLIDKPEYPWFCNSLLMLGVTRELGREPRERRIIQLEQILKEIEEIA